MGIPRLWFVQFDRGEQRGATHVCLAAIRDVNRRRSGVPDDGRIVMTHPDDGSAGQPPLDNEGQPPVTGSSEQSDLGLSTQTLSVPESVEPEAPVRKRRRGLVAGIVVAAVVVVAGGVTTAVAVNRANAPGSSSPQAAASKLLADIGNDDLLGVVNDLPPSEATLFSSTITDAGNQLKRIGVTKPGVSAQAATGLAIHTSGIRFDTSAVQQVNDHIAITQLVAGTITIGGKLSANDYTASFLSSAFPNGVPAAGGPTTIDIANMVKQSGHPVRIATVRVGGRWYPSVFYTIADSVLRNLHQNWPATTLAARGADVPNEAAEDFLQELFNADAKDAIAHTSPVEMGALHDMGQALVNATRGAKPTGVRLGPILFDDRHVTKQEVDAVVQNMTFTLQDGQKIVLTHTGTCYALQQGGKQTQLCASNIADQLRSDPLAKALPASVANLLQDLFAGPVSDGVGIVTVESRELWYVEPGRTVTQLLHDMYGSLKADDLAAVLRLGS
jgi:hypothetical protein